jgi:hypothetical protein
LHVEGYVLYAPDKLSFPAACPKTLFVRCANTVSGVPSLSPLHRRRSGHAGHNEMRGGKWRDRRVSNSRKHRSFTLMATEVQARRLVSAAQPPRVAGVRTPPRVPALLASSRAIFPPLLATPASIKGLPCSMVAAGIRRKHNPRRINTTCAMMNRPGAG